jgi:hypothetical protein
MPILDNNRTAELGRFFKSLKDRPLEPTDPAYVEGLHRDGIDHTGDPIGDLTRQVLWDDGGGTYLFTGQRGTGKSTELRRLRRDLEDAGCAVFLLDMSEYVNETQPVEIGDFLISLMGALSDAVDKAAYGQAADRSYWVRIRDLMQSDLVLKEFDLKGLKFSLKQDATFKEKIQTATRGNLTALTRDARAFAQDIVQLVRDRDGEDKKIVVIADSVERLRGVNAEDAQKVFASVVALFSGNPDNLKFPYLHMVYSVPPYLSALTANLSALYSSQMVSLTSAHVFCTPKEGVRRQPSDDGLNKMTEMVTRRYPGWRDVLSENQLRRLACSSGGDMRDFFRLIAQCLVKAGNPAVKLPVSDSLLADIENAMRREMLPIPEDDRVWLKKISQSHGPELASIDKLPTLGRFLDTRLILNYRNGSDWYDVHPLLWDTIADVNPAPENATGPD